MNEVIKSKGFKIAALVVAFVIVALISFAGGAKVGSHRALFSCKWGENYERNFMGSKSSFGRSEFRGSMMRGIEGRDFRNSHGLSGAIISIIDNKLIIKDKDGKENTVEVSDKTLIRSRRDNLKISDLKQDDQIVIMGSPNETGVITASLIRIFNNN